MVSGKPFTSRQYHFSHCASFVTLCLKHLLYALKYPVLCGMYTPSNILVFTYISIEFNESHCSQLSHSLILAFIQYLSIHFGFCFISCRMKGTTIKRRVGERERGRDRDCKWSNVTPGSRTCLIII